MEALNNNQELRPLFFEFIGKSMAIGLIDLFEIENVTDRARLYKEYYTSLQVLSEKLNKVIPNDKVDEAIQQVTKYYMKDGKVYFSYDYSGEN